MADNMYKVLVVEFSESTNVYKIAFPNIHHVIYGIRGCARSAF